MDARQQWPSDPAAWLSLEQAAQLFRVTRQTMQKWALHWTLQGTVPVIQNRNGIWISGPALWAALRQRPQPIGAPSHES